MRLDRRERGGLGHTGAGVPIHLHVDEGQGLAEAIFEGRVVEADVDEALDVYLAPEYAELPLGLFDFTGITELDLTTEVIRRVATRIGEAVDPGLKYGKVAIVAVGDEFSDLARTYQILRDPSPVEVKVFEQRRDALRWLGLPLGDDPE